MPLLRSSCCPSFETILPSSFDSKTIADEIVRTRPDVALVSGMLQDSSFDGYSVLRTIQPLNLATRLILLLEDCETDLVTHGSSLLSKCEEDFVALVADGLTNRQISEQLKLSEHTVKNYLFKVFEKLGISTRVELVLHALFQSHRSDPAIAPMRMPQPTDSNRRRYRSGPIGI